MIKNFIKKIARKILSKEIEEKERLINRLQGYALPHLPEIKCDGEDQTYNMQFHFDVYSGAMLPLGNIPISSVITLHFEKRKTTDDE